MPAEQPSSSASTYCDVPPASSLSLRVIKWLDVRPVDFAGFFHAIEQDEDPAGPGFVMFCSLDGAGLG